MGDIPQIQTRVDIEKLHAQSSSTAIRRRNISDKMQRSRNMDSQQRTRKNDSIDATQDVATHHSNIKKIQKIEKQEIRTNEEIEETDINDMRSTDESGDGLSTTTHNDVDSEVSFEDDADEEIDTTSIEEEDWIEYIEKKH